MNKSLAALSGAELTINFLHAWGVKTYDYFLRVLTNAVRGVYSGNIGGSFVDILSGLIKGQLQQAYETAWTDAGYEMPLPDWLAEPMQESIDSQNNFDWIYQYYKDIVDARTDQTPIEPLLSRVELWANQYNAAYNNSERLILINEGGNLQWQKGATEHGCQTCADLDGIVMSAREWDALDVHPQGYPNPKLECGGGGPGNNCDCKLVATDKRRSPKAFDMVLNIVSK